MDRIAKPMIEDLQKSESYYRFILENLQEGLWIVDSNLNFKFVNHALCDIFGLSQQEIIGHNVRDFVSESEFRKILKESSIRKKGLSSRYELNINRKNGSQRITFISAAPWMNEDSEFQGAIGLIIDKTEQKRIENALNESEERYRSLVDNIGMGIALIDSDYNIKMVNPKQVSMSGKPAEKLINMKCYREFERREAVCPFCPGSRALSNGSPDEVETRRTREDGSSFEARVQAFPIFGNDNTVTGFIEVVEDISDRKKMKDEIQELFEARLQAESRQNESAQLAAQAAQLASIGVIAAGITHEINQPLSAIQMHANTLQYLIREKKYVLPDPFNKIFTEISEGTKRINSIVQHMRSFWVSPNSEPIEDINLSEAVASAITLVNRKALSHSIRLNVDLSPYKLLIAANKLQIEQIVINLVINAIHSLDKMTSPKKMITISTSASDDISILKVADNGIGLPAGKYEYLFNPFFSTKKPGEGMGLGLAIVKMFVDRFNGEIEAVSNEEGGATFIIRFPLMNVDRSAG
ncbi:PAS domain S-box protein [bacterium]|nr:PAS domain S-box protein [FCB group bacterium]MBL7191627.1 PAS domain S-box protein [bacterium]